MHPDGCGKVSENKGYGCMVHTPLCAWTMWTMRGTERLSSDFRYFPSACSAQMLAARDSAMHTPNRGKGGHPMARVPITVYLLPEQLAGIERRAAQVGKQRSAWVADTLVRALDDELLPLDEILLDQLTKLRAGLETMVEAQAGRGPDAKARLADMRQRSRDLAARMQAEARERLRR